MSTSAQRLVMEFDLAAARRAILRYQPRSHWVSILRDPTPRMTIGFGLDLGRAETSELLKQVGLDPAAVRSGRAPISDAQMDELFDLTLRAAVSAAHRRIPGFGTMAPEQQWALLELMVWLGSDGSESVFSELEQRSLPLSDQPLEPSPWFDVRPEASAPEPAEEAPPGDQSLGELSDDAPAVLTFESFGLAAGLVSDDPDLLDAARAMLPPGWRATDRQPSVQFGIWTDGLITVDGRRADRAMYRGDLLLKLGAVVRHHLATEAVPFTFVHAGVVDVDGCGIVIPGHSYTGKSTLVAELVRLGAKYVSDEYAVLDPSGLVQPFPKPLSIRTGRDDPLGQLVPVPQEQVAEEPVRAGLIVLTSYAPGARWRPSVHSRGEGAFALLQNTVSARLRPRAALSVTTRVARPAVFLAGRRGEASEAARALLESALLQSGSSATVVA